MASLIPVRPSAQIIRISFTPRFFKPFKTESQYLALSFSPISMVRTSFEKREEKYQEDKAKLEKPSSRNEEITTLITKLYEDHALGKIPVKHFDRLFNTYDTEQQDLEKQIQYFEQELESYHQRKVDTYKFLKMIEKYTDIEELTVPMINEYIEKVVVHEATGGRKGKDRQQVDVHFNFIGNI